MSEEQLKAFLEKVQGDKSLQEKLNAASDANAVISIAQEEGFSLSIDDIKVQKSELSDMELEGVAGGTAPDAARCCAGRLSGCAGGTMAGTL